MQRDDPVRLRHMLDAARESLFFAENKTRSDLDADRKLVLALVKDIEIIGEAAANVTDRCQENMPQIPWSNITGMRNRLVHAYFDINLDILWKTVIEDLPPLVDELEKIVPPEAEI